MTLGLDMAEQELLRDADVRHLMHPLTPMARHEEVGPIIVASSQGNTLTFADGSTVIDGTAGLWCVNVGHGRRELAEAAYRQMLDLSFSGVFGGMATASTIRLADRIAALFPGDVDALFFTSGGSEANESAFKIARHHWSLKGRPEKTVVLSHDRGYHGLSLAGTAATGLQAYRPGFGPMVPGFEHWASPYCYRAGAGHPDGDCAAWHAAALEARIDEIGADRIAAVIVEPVIGTGGVIVPPVGYLREIRAICDRHEILLISDEVITGFGRTGTWFGADRDGVVPDMITFAKGITSGYFPFGGVGLRRPIWDALHEVPGDRPLFHGFTYCGHPVGSAVAMATLDVMEADDLLSAVRERGAQLQRRILDLAGLPQVGEVRGIGLMAGIELVEDKATKARFDPARKRGGAVLAEARRRGLQSRALLDDIMLLAPPFTITEAQIDRAVDILGEAIVATA